MPRRSIEAPATHCCKGEQAVFTYRFLCWHFRQFLHQVAASSCIFNPEQSEVHSFQSMCDPQMALCDIRYFQVPWNINSGTCTPVHMRELTHTQVPFNTETETPLACLLGG